MTPPVNISFAYEGAEESASEVDLDILEKHRQTSWSGLAVWEQGTKQTPWNSWKSLWNAGIVTFDAKVKSADVDIHSRAGNVESAPWYLICAL